MNKTIKTLALVTATIGLATVIKRVQKQNYSNEGIKLDSDKITLQGSTVFTKHP